MYTQYLMLQWLLFFSTFCVFYFHLYTFVSVCVDCCFPVSAIGSFHKFLFFFVKYVCPKWLLWILWLLNEFPVAQMRILNCYVFAFFIIFPSFNCNFSINFKVTNIRKKGIFVRVWNVNFVSGTFIRLQLSKLKIEEKKTR